MVSCLRNLRHSYIHQKTLLHFCFGILCTTEGFSKLTVGDLKGHLEDKTMLRRDVLVALVDHGVKDGDLLTDVFSPDSDLLNSVSTLLNKKSPGVKNWRNLLTILVCQTRCMRTLIQMQKDQGATQPK
ncbi:hypothetical protein OS493_024832 [Desmophyllum pertusum]|uniref:CARD domain-containing protein n=1 Tax=Desmophyllum pertusum TaxID=174260 RepID=A0A9W9ZAN1_9CNID|nr:hypothetical protein OS493_024832 [Desmophyllum pertusum]